MCRSAAPSSPLRRKAGNSRSSRSSFASPSSPIRRKAGNSRSSCSSRLYLDRSRRTCTMSVAAQRGSSAAGRLEALISPWRRETTARRRTPGSLGPMPTAGEERGCSLDPPPSPPASPRCARVAARLGAPSGGMQTFQSHLPLTGPDQPATTYVAGHRLRESRCGVRWGGHVGSESE